MISSQGWVHFLTFLSSFPRLAQHQMLLKSASNIIPLGEKKQQHHRLCQYNAIRTLICLDSFWTTPNSLHAFTPQTIKTDPTQSNRSDHHPDWASLDSPAVTETRPTTDSQSTFTSTWTGCFLVLQRMRDSPEYKVLLFSVSFYRCFFSTTLLPSVLRKEVIDVLWCLFYLAIAFFCILECISLFFLCANWVYKDDHITIDNNINHNHNHHNTTTTLRPRRQSKSTSRPM
jgi:hypothetical protein